ncbi:MAG: hypothetical protein RI957_911 [Verrucomicrobiota bacterium]|jgi:hypothetical protein
MIFHWQFPPIWSLLFSDTLIASGMNIETTKQFNERLAQWVANQGFWFQLRYSMAGGGTSVLMYHALRLLLKVMIFLCVVAALLLFFLFRRTEQEAFRDDLRDRIIAGFDCQSGKMKSFNRTQNRASIRYLALKGGPNSYIEDCEATGISFRMGLLDGLVGTWDANQISVERMSLNVKAGAETEEEGQALARALSKRFESLRFQALECQNTRISWGYSLRTMGSISQSRMTAIRDQNGWRLRFTGGIFQQNWLKNLEIDELILVCNGESIVVEKGSFIMTRPLAELSEHKTHGRVQFEDLRVTGGLRPAFSGSVIFENVPLYKILQDSYKDYVEGSVSGRLKILGSTNSTDGVMLSGRVSLNEADEIVLRSQLPLLNSLSILSPAGSFRKTTFSEGYFNIKTSGGILTISDINLTAPEQMEMRGGFMVRPAKPQEINEMLRKGSITDEIAQGVIATSAEIPAGSDELSLRRAMQLAGKNQGVTAAFDTEISDNSSPFAAEILADELQIKTAEKQAITAVFDGKVSLTMPSAPFANAPSVAKMSRVIDATSLEMDCMLDGNLFDITRVQAENLLVMEKKQEKPATENPPSAENP